MTRRPKQEKPARVPVAALCQALQVSPTMVDRYTARGMPRGSVAEAVQWRSQNIKTRTRRVTDSADIAELNIELKRAELEERLENAKQRRIANDELEASLVRRADIVAEMGQVLLMLSSTVQSLPERAASHSPPELAEAVTKWIANALAIALKELTDGLLSSKSTTPRMEARDDAAEV